MNRVSKRCTVFLGMAILAALPFQANAAGVVADTVTEIADVGPAYWWLDHNTVMANSGNERFVMGGFGKSDNYLSVDANYSLTASNGLLVGAAHSWRNQLNIQTGGNVTVEGTLKVGEGTISHYSRFNRVSVTGSGAVLAVNGYLDLSNGGNATDNALQLSDGGIAVAESFSLYNHWSYGNSWLELDDGALFLEGDKTGDFAYGSGILSSIKVWDDVNDVFERVAYYSSTTWHETAFLDYLAVDYINDAAQAAFLGYSDDFVGFTVVRDVNPVPEPGTVLLLGFGLAGLIGSKVRRRE